jgi:hypothetical protein
VVPNECLFCRYSAKREISLAKQQLQLIAGVPANQLEAADAAAKEHGHSPSHGHHHQHQHQSPANAKQAQLKQSIVRMKQRLTTLKLMLQTVEDRRSQHLPKHVAGKQSTVNSLVLKSAGSVPDTPTSRSQPTICGITQVKAARSVSPSRRPPTTLGANQTRSGSTNATFGFSSSSLREYQELPKVTNVPNFYKADHTWQFGYESRYVLLCGLLSLTELFIYVCLLAARRST